MTLMWDVIIVSIILASTSRAYAADSCSNSTCLNDGACDDGSGSAVCHCPLLYVGDRCQYELDPIGTAECMVASSTLGSATCSLSVDWPGVITNGLQTGWVADGSEDGVGAFIILNLMQAYSVIGIKYSQRCDPQNQIKRMAVSLNDGTIILEDVACSTTADCDGQHGGTILFDQGKPNTSIVKIVIMELCNSALLADVGFRDISVFTSIDECSEGTPCLHNGECIEEELGFNCNCSGTGFQGDFCEENIDDCVNMTCGHGTCQDLVNGAQCQCDSGYDGDQCDININECASDPCVHGACNDEVNGYSCECDDGYEGDTCNEDINECASDPCVHGTCDDEVNGYNCECHDGYEGDNCNEDINECASNPCVHGTCNDEVNGYGCSCEDGYEGDNCNEDIDECEPNPCIHGACDDEINDYSCTCDDGYEGPNCGDDIDDCLPDPCVHGSCNDSVNSYVCTCQEGYEGVNCSTIDNCSSDSCSNNGTCVSNSRGFDCICPVRYRGLRCQIDNGCAIIDPAERVECGFGGIRKKQCLISGCCYDKSVRRVSWCFQAPQVADPCLFLTCFNNGTCQNTSSVDAVCVCGSGWTGRYCENEISAETTCHVTERTECGWRGISQWECEVVNQCCFSPKAGTYYCYHSQKKE